MRLATALLRLHHRRRLLHLASISTSFLSDRFAVSSCPLPLPPFSPTAPSRSISWFSWKHPSDSGNGSESDFSADISDAGSQLTQVSAEYEDGDGLAGPVQEAFGTAEGVDSGSVWDLPVNSAISLLDVYQELTGLPWWIIISSSTIALRSALLPVLLLQLKKAHKFGTIFPKLPPPFPPPLSGRSFREQYSLFSRKRKELGCPSFLWNFAFISVQFPCFLLWMASVRRMCLNSHPGFDNGGILWFQNLTDLPHGILGPTFPILIAGLHYLNVQISFGTIQSRKLPGILGLLAKYYKLYLDILSLPLLFVGFCVPQGSLVYWVSNSFFTLSQQLLLKNPHVRTKLGLPDIKNLQKEHTRPPNLPSANKILMEDGVPFNKPVNPENILPVNSSVVDDGLLLDDLPQKIVDKALQSLAAGDPAKALPLLRKALEKDPDIVQALIAMGQILCSQGSFAESARYFESAISKIQDREDSLLVLAYFGAGVSHLWQENKPEAMKHLRSISELNEPDNVMGKACYHQGLVILGRAMFEDGDKSEALKFLRIAAAYDPAVNGLIKKYEVEDIQSSGSMNDKNVG